MKTKIKVTSYHDRNSGEFLFFGLFIEEGKKLTGIADGNKPMEFKTRKEAKEYARRFLNSENPNSVSNQPDTMKH
jgi:hypothetical protein